ncbi:hypothetical protein BDR03DRAFT_951244, partial [Suillus americanus]
MMLHTKYPHTQVFIVSVRCFCRGNHYLCVGIADPRDSRLELPNLPFSCRCLSLSRVSHPTFWYWDSNILFSRARSEITSYMQCAVIAVFQRFAHHPSAVLSDMRLSLVATFLNADPVWFTHMLRAMRI